MRDLLDWGSEWLEKQRRKHAAREIIYSRGVSSVTVTATIGRSEFEIDDGNGLAVRLETRDYLVHVEDLTLDDILIQPQSGDRIHEGDIGAAVIYEVAALPGQQPWQHSDPYRRVYRIHTKQVDDQTPTT